MSRRAAETEFPPGVAVLPEDFAERLAAVKERSGLPWERMAVCMGVDPRQLWRWRHGASPGGGAMLALVRFATRVEGLGDLLGEDLVVVRPERRR
ncbi:MAG: hypothetical protein F4Z07_00040 [Dehalococcoidia bacterium]|nr:hypothetical protein [Dehalococcoidia bacterium]